jgi:hypothetical protein
MAEVEEGGVVRCEVCGALKPASGCACGGQGRGTPTVPEGWDPQPTRSSRPRLQIVTKARPETSDADADAAPAPGPDGERPG